MSECRYMSHFNVQFDLSHDPVLVVLVYGLQMTILAVGKHDDETACGIH